MQILLLILLLLFGILLSMAVDRRVEQTLPPYIGLFLVFLYLLAILKKPHHSFELSFVVFVGIWGFYIVRKRRVFPGIKEISEYISFNKAPGFWCYLITLAVMMICYGNHVVNNWDDFHFNATFARDMFTYKGMPVGVKAATGYKTYKPFMQCFYNWGFQGIGRFDEPLMFRFKSFLLFTGMLPMFDLVRDCKRIISKIAAVVAAVILPFSFMFEVVDSLSMDGMMGILFGYCLILILRSEERDWFYYVRASVGLACLVMVKSTGALFMAIAAGTWLMVIIHDALIKKKNGEIPDSKELLRMVITIIPSGALWLSWKIFCDWNGNTTFLNNILGSHLEGEGGLPSYGKQTIINAFKQLFTLSMNLGKIGTTFGIVVLIAIVALIVMTATKTAELKDKIIYLCVLLCTIPYIAVLIYTYLYVFFDYEAMELASYDRYLGTYALGIMMLVLYDCFKAKSHISEKVGIAATVILLCTLNFPYLFNSLIPGNYTDSRLDIIVNRNEANEEIEQIFGLTGDANPIIIVGNESNTVYARSLDYAVLPMVSSYVDIHSYDADTDGDGYGDIDGSAFADRFDGENPHTGGVIEDLTERFENGYDGYVYFNNRLVDSGEAEILSLFVENGEIERGVLYKCNKGSKLVPAY